MVGFSDVIGSWKIIADVVAADLAHIGFGEPDEVAAVQPDGTPGMWPTLGSSFMTDRPIVVLPQPDSPTSPRHSPVRTENDTPSTARTLACADGTPSADRLLRAPAVDVPAVFKALVPLPSGSFATCSGYPTEGTTSCHGGQAHRRYQDRRRNDGPIGRAKAGSQQ